ncbi:MAG: FHA domain-containing protein [Nannocystaceae bacterium]
MLRENPASRVGMGGEAAGARVFREPEASPELKFRRGGEARLDASAGRAEDAGAVLLVLVGRDGAEGEALPITGPLELGTDAEVGIRFPDDRFVSPRHARIEPTGEGLRVTDLSSRNGVFVRIGTPVPVYPGDTFLLGHQLLRLDGVEATPDTNALDTDRVRGFGTPLPPAWGKLTLLAIGAVACDTYHLRGKETRLGRETGEILFPHDAFLSRAHARLRMEVRSGGMNVVVEDMGSANGTYLRVRGHAELHRGDMFRIGDQVLRVKA